jgi:hypothetical protein
MAITIAGPCIDERNITERLRDAYCYDVMGLRHEAAAEIDQLRSVLAECANDLEAEVEARYSHGIKEHPAMTPKYESDMQPVKDARKLLGAHARSRREESQV